jgi:hypothetical protein
MVLGLVILWVMLGNRQSTFLESIRLKTDGQSFQNIGMLHPAGTMYHKAIVVLCHVLSCPGTNGLSRLLP